MFTSITKIEVLLNYYFLFLTVAIKKRSRVPGVMIIQYFEELPEGQTTPDFIRKPVAATVQEGIKQ